jgi:hypothetical protein
MTRAGKARTGPRICPGIAIFVPSAKLAWVLLRVGERVRRASGGAGACPGTRVRAMHDACQGGCLCAFRRRDLCVLDQITAPIFSTTPLPFCPTYDK